MDTQADLACRGGIIIQQEEAQFRVHTAGVLLHGQFFVGSQQAAARHTCQARWRTSLASRAGKLCLVSTDSYGNLHVILSSNALPSNCPGWKARSSLECHVRAHSCFFSCPNRNHVRLGIRGIMLPQYRSASGTSVQVPHFERKVLRTDGRAASAQQHQMAFLKGGVSLGSICQ